MDNIKSPHADGEGYARLFRMLSAANKEADYLKLPMLVHLTNMALLQLTMDWEGVETEDDNDTQLRTLFSSKTNQAFAAAQSR